MPLDPHEVQAETVRYLVAKNQELAAEVARLQDLADARLYRAYTARITLESVGIPRSEPVDVSAARAAGMIEDLRAEVDRLTAALAAAQPVVEWRRLPPAISMDLPQGWGATRGRLDFVVYDHPGESVGWKILVQRPAGRSVLYADGPETGPAGKAACEAAYRRACGLPAIPACAG